MDTSTRHQPNQNNRYIFSLRSSILFVFIGLFIAVVLLIVTINYITASRTLSSTANRLMRQASTAIYQGFQQEIENILKDNTLSVQLFSDGVLNRKNLSEIRVYVFDLAKGFDIVQGAHWGDEKGNFVSAEYGADNTIKTFLVNRDSSTAFENQSFYSSQGKLLQQQTSNKITYDPRVQSFYRIARQRRETTWTDVYSFPKGNYLGISITTPVFDQKKRLAGVFAMDIQLKWLSWYISQFKVSENTHIFIVNNAGEVLAYSRLKEMPESLKRLQIASFHTPAISKSYAIYKKNKQSEFNFSFNKKTYLAVYKTIPYMTFQPWLIGIITPRDDFIGEVKKTVIINSLVSFILLILGIFLISRLVSFIVNPIKRLVTETQKIKHLDLSGNLSLKSRIKEIISLKDAFHGMKQGIRSFCSYIPMTLVRQLIETGQDARLGGSKKTVAVLFTDIQDFTAITNKIKPDELMEKLCYYFDVLTHIITKEKGTIDKYIGDSIMAIWGAPVSIAHPCYHAANAALAIVERLAQLNEQWLKEGHYPFYTRIGIHFGKAIVGNLGSSERLNYTAVGETINMANRLEGVNKKYGTQIMVSRAFYEAVKKDFVFKALGKTEIKGFSELQEVYELLAKR